MRATNSTRTEPATDGADQTQAWNAATELADWVGSGGHLPNMPSPVLLDLDEVLHADLPAQGWRFHGADVTYVAPHVFAIGGPLMFGLTAAGSAIARRRARHEAEALAAPQWRPLGALRILVTDRRLLVWHKGAWASVWYGVIREIRPDLAVGRLDMIFEDDPPYCLAGPWVPYLTVIVTTLLAGDRGVRAIEDALAVPHGA